MREGEAPDKPVDGQAQSDEPDGHGAAYRCFLFADLRGFTSFIERSGNAAGVELLDDYLAILRRAVSGHHGAEIKVEGDGFHAVFPSASSAVLCGLDIVNAAEEANAARPDRPINVGVGIHAGEAVETPDGFVGSAVNIAARVCAAAAAGEVLVTGTVRGITQASIPVGFVSRGRRALKGIADPVEVFAVVHGRSPPASRPRLPKGVGIGAGVAALGVAAIAGLVLLAQILGTPAPQGPAATATPGPLTPSSQLAIGPLVLGSYVTEQFDPTFSFVISDPGWSLYRIADGAVGLYHGPSPEGRIDVATIDVVNANPCTPEGETISAGSTALDLVSAMQFVPFLEVGVPERTDLAGHPGQSVDVTLIEGALAACGSFGTGEVALFPAGPEIWSAEPAERFRLQAFDVDGSTVAFVLSSEAAAASSVQELETFLELADRVVQSVDF